MCGVAALTVAACAPRDSETSWGNNNSDSGGGAYSEIDDEEVKSITVFKNDWAAFNNARQANSPVYQKLKEQIGCDIEALTVRAPIGRISWRCCNRTTTCPTSS